ncbi:unnamed protein product [Ectocarpus sp. 12 AP-2014]
MFSRNSTPAGSSCCHDVHLHRYPRPRPRPPWPPKQHATKAPSTPLSLKGPAVVSWISSPDGSLRGRAAGAAAAAENVDFVATTPHQFSTRHCCVSSKSQSG